MPRRGEPFDPDDPQGERTFTAWVDPKLLPKPDVSEGVTLDDREGVFAESFRCRPCRLHFVLFTWVQGRHLPETVVCPECRSTGEFLHQTTRISYSRQFRMDHGREPEIFDLWPFRLPPETEAP